MYVMTKVPLLQITDGRIVRTHPLFSLPFFKYLARTKQRKLHADYQVIEKSYIKSFITRLCVFANLSPVILYGWRKASRALSHTFHISHNPFLEQIISR